MTLEPQLQIKTRTRTRRPSPCYRHQAEPVTGFCALCLRERLAGLDPSGLLEPSSSTTTAFASSSGGAGASTFSRRGKPAVPSSSFSPDLRRSKSVSASKCDASSRLSCEPRRKSCDVRVRNTLSNLFNLDDEKSGSDRVSKVESKNLGFSSVAGPVFESREEDDNDGEEIRVSEAIRAPNLNVDDEVEGELKTMKEHIDLEWQKRKDTARDLRDIAGSVWVAASVFSKKLQKWRQKQKMRKRSSRNGERIVGSGSGRGDRRIGGQSRDTQSEIADYGIGRRSCDTDPRFSIDAGRISVDDSRFSFDEPRASWDGYLIARTIPRLTPMLSVVENAMLSTVNHSIEEQDETTSGGSAHTNSDSSSSQRGSSFDRSSSFRSSNRKTLGVEVDEVKSITNAKVSPATSGIFHGTKLVITERELKDWHLKNSLKDDHSDNLESVPKDATSVATGKKSSTWRKVCNIWGSRLRLSDIKYEDYASNIIGHTVVEACEEQPSEVDGVEKGDSIGKLTRSSSCVGSNNSRMIGSYHGTRSVAETRGSAKKGRDEFVLDRNRSTGYSPSSFDNGLLRFHLTPFRSYRRSKSGKSKLQDARNSLQSN